MLDHDGLHPLPYRDLRDRLASFGVYEIEDDGLAERFPRVRWFQMDMMSVGAPYYPVVYDGDDAIVQTPVIRKLLETCQINAHEFASAEAT